MGKTRIKTTGLVRRVPATFCTWRIKYCCRNRLMLIWYDESRRTLQPPIIVIKWRICHVSTNSEISIWRNRPPTTKNDVYVLPSSISRYSLVEVMFLLPINVAFEQEGSRIKILLSALRTTCSLCANNSYSIIIVSDHFQEPGGASLVKRKTQAAKTQEDSPRLVSLLY